MLSDKVVESKVRFLSLLVIWRQQNFQNLLPNHDAEMTGVRHLSLGFLLRTVVVMGR